MTTISFRPHLLASLFEGPKLDRELRSLIKETFPEFCAAQTAEVQTISFTGKESVDGDDIGNRGSDAFEARFSDDDMDGDGQSPKKDKLAKDGKGLFEVKKSTKLHLPKSESSSDAEQLSDAIKISLLALEKEK